MRQPIVCFFFLLLPAFAHGYVHSDTLRGSNGTGRNWWKVVKYDLHIAFDSGLQTISGSNTITLRLNVAPGDSMQLDLQSPMQLDSVVTAAGKPGFVREGNVYWVQHPFANAGSGKVQILTAYFHGAPRTAINPPWDGGFVKRKDAGGKPWAAVACQGLGASVWWPCKDAQWEEPDSGMTISYSVPQPLVCVGNGKFIAQKDSAAYTNWNWQVTNPINNYDVSFYIGEYVHWHDTLTGEKGTLDIDYWVLRDNEARARKPARPPTRRSSGQSGTPPPPPGPSPWPPPH